MADSVNLTEADFDAIKSNIKTFLSSQSEFSDFDFEGSGINVLLNILSYFTHYMALQSNMSFSEMYLDTAQLRNNVISRSKESGYIPSQSSAPSAVINVSVTDTIGAPASVTIPKGTKFSSIKDGVVYTFTVTDEEILPDTGGNVYSKDITVYQGEIRTFNFTADNSILNQKFILPDVGVDVSFLNVVVRKNGAGTTPVEYRYERDITQVLPDDEVYFYAEDFDNKIEIYFGDGVIGHKPVTGEYIETEYLVTDGIEGNSINNFTLTENISGYNSSDFTITMVQKSQGGRDQETIERIKLIAPKTNEAQNRAVITNDYKALLLNEFPLIQTINVWGGEDNIPVAYGKVFLCIKPFYGDLASIGTKTAIQEFLQKYNVVGIQSEIVDPEYIYVDVVSNISYSNFETDLGSSGLLSLVQSELASYIDNISDSFESVLRYSQTLNYIDEIDPSIKSNLTELFISRKFTPVPFESNGLVIEFVNPISENSLNSSWTGTTGDIFKLFDDAGVIKLSKNDVEINSNQGSVDYETGVVVLSNLVPDISNNTEINIQVKPSDYDIESSRNVLIRSGNLTDIQMINIEKE